MRHVILAAGAAALLTSCAARPGQSRADLVVTLNGLQEVPGPGDPDGNGTAEVRVEPANGRLCWNLYVRDIGRPTAAHIHRGAEGAAGPPVVTIETPGADGHSRGCAALDSALAAEIARAAHGFYLNVHGADFPAGAIRGQLRGGPIGPQRLRTGS